ncbi:MAG: efflux RND transporter permease subunit [Planctomycetota bacterium]|nr:efflux RND transporter permease subunit [Planctomycetota bacterium]
MRKYPQRRKSCPAPATAHPQRVLDEALTIKDGGDALGRILDLFMFREIRGAVANAGRVRMRPILLTTLTTIGGLLPLSLFGGALWAPMTNGMIFGLIVSTVLTLFVIPSLYVLLAEKFGMKVARVESS